MRLRFRVHAGAGIGDRQQNIFSGLHHRMRRAIKIVELHVRRFDGEAAALGMASREFTARFMMTCSIWLASARMVPKSDELRTTSSMSSPIKRGMSLPISSTTEFRFIARGCSTCMRLNASSWRVRAVARSAERSICSILRVTRSVGGKAFNNNSVWPLITIRNY